jgi:hypothetical protein
MIKTLFLGDVIRGRLAALCSDLGSSDSLGFNNL